MGLFSGEKPSMQDGGVSDWEPYRACIWIPRRTRPILTSEPHESYRKISCKKQIMTRIVPKAVLGTSAHITSYFDSAFHVMGPSVSSYHGIFLQFLSNSPYELVMLPK